MHSCWSPLVLATLCLLTVPVSPTRAQVVTGAVPAAPTQDPIPILRLRPPDARKVIALSGTINKGKLELSNVEIRGGYAPEDFGGADRIFVQLLGSDNRVVAVESFIDPRRIEELDGGELRHSAASSFDVSIPYRPSTMELRLQMPTGVKPGANKSLPNGVQLFQLPGATGAVRVSLREAFSAFCQQHPADPDCKLVLNPF